MAKAFKFKAKESAAPATFRARINESARIIEALPDAPNGKKIFKVVLITEGLGNLRQRNYYGPEAIESAVKIYEGKPSYINHQSADEEKNLPERDSRDLAGYYKNLKVEIIKGKKACAGEIHCDLSDSGRFLAEKIQSALMYQKDFPDRTQEYCGFSINGDGDAEPREIDTEAGTLSVNYVTSFTEDSESCDLVTTPARGGKAVSVIKESQANPKENVMKNVIKALTTAFSKVTESAKKATGDNKTPLLEVAKALTEAMKLAEAEGEEAEAMPAFLAKKEGESVEDHVARLKAIKKEVDAMIPKEMNESQEALPAPEEKPAPAACESRRPLTADDLERNMLAVKSVMREANLPADCYPDTKITKLAKMSFKEAKAIIEGDAQLATSIMRESGVEPVASLRHTAESTGGRKAAFIESFKQEEN
jgi:hypothetical protein